MMIEKSYKNILVHTCCAPCSTYVFENLISNGVIPVGYFYNPNIHPEDEYERRLEELLYYADLRNYKIIVNDGDKENWLDAISGYENDKEGAKRCEICFQFRLEMTALYAKQNKFDCFTTVLSISPHKNSKLLNEIGKKLEHKYDIPYLEADFKKNNGFKISIELSKKYNLYRQNYCGCEFSIRK